MLQILASSIALLLVATAAALVVLRRSGDPRPSLLAGVFALLAAATGAALWSLEARPLGFDAQSVAAGLVLAASLLAPFTVLAVARTLHERDRSETLHWSSMETVRSLSGLAARTDLSLEERMQHLLELGCEQLGLETGWVARLEGEGLRVQALRGAEGLPLERGTLLPADSAWCRSGLDASQPVEFSREPDAAVDALPFATCFVAALRPGDEPWGHLAFASASPRRPRIGATEKDLLTLMARWLCAALERRVEPATVATSAAPEAPAAPRLPATGWTTRPLRAPQQARAARPGGSLDVNARLRALKRRLARVADAPLELQLSPDLAPARTGRIPLDRVLLALVGHAAAAGGSVRLEIASANLDVGSALPGALPAVAPDRYVTIAVRVRGDDIDPEALNRAFDAPGNGAAPTPGADALPLPTLYRLLQAGGGDLSLSAERGRWLALTVFLPRAAEDAEAAPAQAAAAAPRAG